MVEYIILGKIRADVSMFQCWALLGQMKVETLLTHCRAQFLIMLSLEKERSAHATITEIDRTMPSATNTLQNTTSPELISNGP